AAMLVSAVPVCFLFLLSVCSACYISNCPIGGRPCGSEGGRCAASGLCCDAESCTTDQSCLIEEEGDDQSSQFEGSDPGDIILRFLHLAGHMSPHRIHQ
uniref:Isotocin-neurophysin IT 1-like n=1 Tax=Acanthochromis polyacanthus TaxID=80966 RepID=A0A3Q1GD29_9TELE